MKSKLMGKILERLDIDGKHKYLVGLLIENYDNIDNEDIFITKDGDKYLLTNTIFCDKLFKVNDNVKLSCTSIEEYIIKDDSDSNKRVIVFSNLIPECNITAIEKSEFKTTQCEIIPNKKVSEKTSDTITDGTIKILENTMKNTSWFPFILTINIKNKKKFKNLFLIFPYNKKTTTSNDIKNRILLNNIDFSIIKFKIDNDNNIYDCGFASPSEIVYEGTHGELSSFIIARGIYNVMECSKGFIKLELYMERGRTNKFMDQSFPVSSLLTKDSGEFIIKRGKNKCKISNGIMYDSSLSARASSMVGIYLMTKCDNNFSRRDISNAIGYSIHTIYRLQKKLRLI